jgi:hypothetical protein
MTEHEPREPERRGDEQDRGPGAHSGREDRPHDRRIPGTASAREGYQTEGGTAHGDPLEGLKREDREDGEDRGAGR